MAFNAARQPFYFSVVISGLLALIFAVRYAVAPYPIEKPFLGGMPLASLMTGFSVEHPWGAGVIAVVLLVWMLFVIVQLTVRYGSATSRNYLPAQFFVIAACGIAVPGEALAAYTAAILLVLSTRQFTSAFRKDYRFQEAFHAGFYAGLIPLLYAPALILWLLIPVAMSLYRRSSREMLVCAVGALMPVPAAGFIYWAMGESGSFIYREMWRCLSEASAADLTTGIPIAAAIPAGLVLIVVFIAVGWFLARRKGMRTRQRKVMAHVSLMLLVIILSLPVPGSSTTVIPLLAVPVAMAIPYSFSGRQAGVSSLLYCVLILVVSALNLSPIFGISLP